MDIKEIRDIVKEYQPMNLIDLVENSFDTYTTNFLFEVHNKVKSLKFADVLFVTGDFCSGKTTLCEHMSIVFPHIYFKEISPKDNSFYPNSIEITKSDWR